MLGGQLLLRSEGDGGVKEGRRSGSDNPFGTKGIDGGLAGFDGSGEIGLPDITTGNKTEREDEGGGFESSDGGFELSGSTVEVDVETSDRKFGNEAEVGVETTEVGGQEDFWGDRGKLGIGGVELALKLETSIENKDGLVDLDPLCTGGLELSQELFVERDDLWEEGDRGKVGGGILGGLAQPQVGDGAQDDRAGRDTEGLGLVKLLNRLVKVELEVGGLGELGHNEMVVRVEPDGKGD